MNFKCNPLCVQRPDYYENTIEFTKLVIIAVEIDLKMLKRHPFTVLSLLKRVLLNLAAILRIKKIPRSLRNSYAMFKPLK